MKQQTEVEISQSSPTSNGPHATGRVPGRCGRQIVIHSRVRERKERVHVLALVLYTLTTRHSTTLEKHTPFWGLINTLIV